MARFCRLKSASDFISVAYIIASGVPNLTFLLQKDLFVGDQVIENGCIEHTLEHDHVTDYLTRQESILQVYVRDEIVKPLLAKLWHTTHLEEVRRFKSINLLVHRLALGRLRAQSAIMDCVRVCSHVDATMSLRWDFFWHLAGSKFLFT